MFEKMDPIGKLEITPFSKIDNPEFYEDEAVGSTKNSFQGIINFVDTIYEGKLNEKDIEAICRLFRQYESSINIHDIKNVRQAKRALLKINKRQKTKTEQTKIVMKKYSQFSRFNCNPKGLIPVYHFTTESAINDIIKDGYIIPGSAVKEKQGEEMFERNGGNGRCVLAAYPMKADEANMGLGTIMLELLVDSNLPLESQWNYPGYDWTSCYWSNIEDHSNLDLITRLNQPSAPEILVLNGHNEKFPISHARIVLPYKIPKFKLFNSNT